MRVITLGGRNPDYLTHREIDAALACPDDVDRAWAATDSAEARQLTAADGVWLLAGTPYRDDDAAFAAIGHCLVGGTPFLGTCGGFQYACVELTRRFAGVAHAAHGETDPSADELVVVPLTCALYGERRLVTPASGTRLASICGSQPFEGFHWCGYGLGAASADRLAA
jgi:CTP synthase (UTP-ammonia lyase)